MCAIKTCGFLETKKILYDVPEASGAIRHHLPTPVDGAWCGGLGAGP